jgi:uncharacterized membrane protein
MESIMKCIAILLVVVFISIMISSLGCKTTKSQTVTQQILEIRKTSDEINKKDLNLVTINIVDIIGASHPIEVILTPDGKFVFPDGKIKIKYEINLGE